MPRTALRQPVRMSGELTARIMFAGRSSSLSAQIVAWVRDALFAKKLKPGDMIRVTTRRGTVELNSRQDDGIPDGVVFIPFAYVEAAANILTNPALDPFGKIPEFKFCAAKVEAAKPRMEAAE